jgi:fibrillarin-like pre-rRNA processing protein
MRMFLKPDGQAIIMVKARSIDVSLKPKDAYQIVQDELEENEITISQKILLSPFEKDHIMFLVTMKEPKGIPHD